MKNIFTLTTFSREQAYLSQKNSTEKETFSKKDNENILFLSDLLFIAPALIQPTFKNDSYKFIYNNKISNIQSIYDYIKNRLNTLNTLEDIADLCINLCEPYKYSFETTKNSSKNLDILDKINLSFEENNFIKQLFTTKDFYHELKYFLILSLLYNHSTKNTPKTLKDILKTFSSSDEQIRLSTNRLAPSKHDILACAANNSNPYIYNILFSLNKTVKADSIYDLLIIYGLFSSSKNSNPYLNLYKNDFFCNLKLFLSKFNLRGVPFNYKKKDLHFFDQYFLERITHINLINKIFSRTSSPSLCLSLLSNYPLVNYRLKIVDHTFWTDQHDSTDIDLFKMVISHHIFFYFPLLNLLFQLLVKISLDNNNLSVNKIPNNELNKFNLPNLFNLNASTQTFLPTIEFPCESIKISNKKEGNQLYSAIQRCVFEVFYDNLLRLKDADFIQNGFEYQQIHSKNNFFYQFMISKYHLDQYNNVADLSYIKNYSFNY